MDNWRANASCKGMDPNDWLLPKGKGSSKDYVDKHRRICATCPVAEDCLKEALRPPIQYSVGRERISTGLPIGMYGGHTGRERRRIKRLYQIATDPDVVIKSAIADMRGTYS